MGVKGAKGKYQAGLARYSGDPRAFVQSQGEARKRADEVGMKIVSGPNNNGSPQQMRSQRRPVANG